MTEFEAIIDSTEVLIDLEWMKKLFPTKEESKLMKWIEILHSNEFDNVGLLMTLDKESWLSLPLPVAIRSHLQAECQKLKLEIENLKVQQKKLNIIEELSTAELEDLSQIDVIVLDISSSMRARSDFDPLKTREDVSKILFHIMMDKLTLFELSHAVGLIAFGSKLTPFNITTNYETFHDQLGRLDANQKRTKLYDAIQHATEMIDSFCKKNNLPLPTLNPDRTGGGGGGEGCIHDSSDPSRSIEDRKRDPLIKRVFVLTDGDDNVSTCEPWELSSLLQRQGIILDAVPLSSQNPTLQALCISTGGLYYDIISEEQSIELFESESTLHVAHRPSISAFHVPLISDRPSFREFSDEVKRGAQIERERLLVREKNRARLAANLGKPSTTTESETETGTGVSKTNQVPNPTRRTTGAVKSSLFDPVMTAAQIDQLTQSLSHPAPIAPGAAPPVTVTVTNPTAPVPVPAPAPAPAPVPVPSPQHTPAVLRRVLREFSEIESNPVPEWSVFMCAGNPREWKAILSGLPHPYVGGSWLLTISFPSDFPFRPPKILFFTPIYHCNILNGRICLDLLADAWSPAVKISRVLGAISNLLLHPDYLNPLDNFKGSLYRDFVTMGDQTYMRNVAAATQVEASESVEDLRRVYHLG